MKTNSVNYPLKQMIFLFMFTSFVCFAGCSKATSRDFYQIKIYSIENEIQEQRMDQYLEKAYLPALHRAGISKVGVFKPIEEDENRDKLILVWIPFKSLDGKQEKVGEDQ